MAHFGQNSHASHWAAAMIRVVTLLHAHVSHDPDPARPAAEAVSRGAAAELGEEQPWTGGESQDVASSGLQVAAKHL